MRHAIFLLSFFLATHTFAQAVYHFEERDVPFVFDDSGKGHHARRSESTAQVPDRDGGLAVRFTGGTSHVRIPQKVFTEFGNTAYVEAWIRPDAYPTGPRGCASTIFRKRADFNDWSLTLQPDGQLSCTLYGAGRVAASVTGGMAHKEVWTKAGCLYDGHTLRLLVHDQQVAHHRQTLTLDWTTNYRVTELGNNTTDHGVNCPDYGFHGLIDDVIISTSRPGASGGETVVCVPNPTLLCLGPFAIRATTEGKHAAVTSRSPSSGSFGAIADAGDVFVTVRDQCSRDGTWVVRIASMQSSRVTITNIHTNHERSYTVTPAAPVNDRIPCKQGRPAK